MIRWFLIIFMIIISIMPINETEYEYNKRSYLTPANEKTYKTRRAIVTGFNTVPNQTDDTPCISGSGDIICGRNDVVACPRDIPFGTLVRISGRYYYCLDRTAYKYNDRFDISFDKDINKAIKWGKQELEVIIYN